VEGGIVREISPRTIGVRGGFAHVFRVTFEDDANQMACVYLAQWAQGEGPEVGEDLHWEEGDTFVTDFVTDASGNRIRKFGEAFNLSKDD
jgi:hypothetical protein